jgi:hypothetical protein
MHLLLPKPVNQNFVISSSLVCLSTELSVFNLMDCHKMNTMHLCEEPGVLWKELKSMQDFAGAMVLCDMEITTQKETILQLQDNWYLAHSPKPYTSHITCRNLSNSDMFLTPGPDRFYFSPSCHLQLHEHLIISLSP